MCETCDFHYYTYHNSLAFSIQLQRGKLCFISFSTTNPDARLFANWVCGYHALCCKITGYGHYSLQTQQLHRVQSLIYLENKMGKNTKQYLIFLALFLRTASKLFLAYYFPTIIHFHQIFFRAIIKS